MMNREQIVDFLWGKVEPILYIRKSDFIENVADWDLVVHQVNGADAFITLQKGPDFHFETLGTGASVPRGQFVTFLSKIIAEHGYAATKTPIEDERQHRFNKAFGFEVVGQDEYDIHYRISRVRGSKCQ